MEHSGAATASAIPGYSWHRSQVEYSKQLNESRLKVLQAREDAVQVRGGGAGATWLLFSCCWLACECSWRSRCAGMCCVRAAVRSPSRCTFQLPRHSLHRLLCPPCFCSTCKLPARVNCGTPLAQTVLHEAFAALAALSKDQNKYKALLTDLLVQVRVFCIELRVGLPASWLKVPVLPISTRRCSQTCWCRCAAAQRGGSRPWLSMHASAAEALWAAHRSTRLLLLLLRTPAVLQGLHTQSQLPAVACAAMPHLLLFT